MANSTTNLDSIQSSSASKEVQANDLFDAASPGTAFGRRASTSSGLTWGYYGGTIFVNGTPTALANGTVTLTNGTNFVELSRTPTVTSNTSAFSAAAIRLYTAVASGGLVTSYTDHRTGVYDFGGYTTQSMVDANQTLTGIQARCEVIECIGAMTAQRNLTIPHIGRRLLIYNNTTGGFGINAIGPTGTGYVIAATKHALVYSNGTNIQGATFT